MVSNETNMTTNAGLEVATALSHIPTKMADIWKQWQEIDNVVHYDGKIYVPQNTAFRTAVISQFHNDVFVSHFGKSRTAELMRRLYDWTGLTLSETYNVIVRTVSNARRRSHPNTSHSGY